MARPKKPIDANQIKTLAQIGCSGDEIAAVVGCSRDLIYKRFSTVLKDGKEHLKASLRRWQYQNAAKGNATMQIWMGKQLLGQVDYIRQEVEWSGTLDLGAKIEKARKRKAEKLKLLKVAEVAVETPPSVGSPQGEN